MSESDAAVLLITTATEEEAQILAKLLLQGGKVACINIIPRVDSLFRWQGEVNLARESLLVVKSKTAMLQEIIEIVKDNHSYEIPEIIALPIIGGSEDYLKWIDAEIEAT